MVRPATAHDARSFGLLERRAGERFRSVGMEDIADDEGLPLPLCLAAVAEARAWVAELDAMVVGYALAVDLGGQPHLEQVSVIPEAGGRGVGAALVAAVLGWAEGRGTTLTLSTFRDVAWNAPWYERLGFRVLADDELDQRLRDVRAHEEAAGLDGSSRVVMRRPLP